MVGLKGTHSSSWWAKEDEISDLVNQIEDELSFVSEEMSDPNEDVLLRALFEYIVGKYDFEDIEYVAASYLDMAKKRYEHEKAQEKSIRHTKARP